VTWTVPSDLDSAEQGLDGDDGGVVGTPAVEERLAVIRDDHHAGYRGGRRKHLRVVAELAHGKRRHDHLGEPFASRAVPHGVNARTSNARTSFASGPGTGIADAEGNAGDAPGGIQDRDGARGRQVAGPLGIAEAANRDGALFVSVAAVSLDNEVAGDGVESSAARIGDALHHGPSRRDDRVAIGVELVCRKNPGTKLRDEDRFLRESRRALGYE